MRFKNPYTTIKQKIELLQRWILVHSYLYYELNDNVVDDKTYDNNAQQLMRYKKKYKADYNNSRYYNIFYDYDGSTGMHLVDRLDGELIEKIKFDIRFLKKD